MVVAYHVGNILEGIYLGFPLSFPPLTQIISVNRPSWASKCAFRTFFRVSSVLECRRVFQGCLGCYAY